jgi:hypothetical protein
MQQKEVRGMGRPELAKRWLSRPAYAQPANNRIKLYSLHEAGLAATAEVAPAHGAIIRAHGARGPVPQPVGGGPLLAACSRSNLCSGALRRIQSTWTQARSTCGRRAAGWESVRSGHPPVPQVMLMHSRASNDARGAAMRARRKAQGWDACAGCGGPPRREGSRAWRIHGHPRGFEGQNGVTRA